jgi:hypothetical protein
MPNLICRSNIGTASGGLTLIHYAVPRLSIVFSLFVSSVFAADVAETSPENADAAIAKHLHDLDNDDFEVRQKASDTLRALAKKGDSAMWQAWLRAPSLEVKTRASEIFTNILLDLEVDAFCSEDQGAYLKARRCLLAHGSTVAPLLEKRLADYPKDGSTAFRIKSILFELQTNAESERVISIVGPGLKRVDEIRKQTGQQPWLMVKREELFTFDIKLNLGGEWIRNPYGELCYMNFSRKSRQYSNDVSLVYENDSLRVRMVGGQESRISDLGLVDYNNVKSAPEAAVTKTWKQESKAIAGHVYIEHVLIMSQKKVETSQTFKLKVLEIGSDWLIIQWDEIPQDK